MSMPHTLRRYLDDKHADFEVTRHPHTHCTQETAQAAHLPLERLAKSVILRDEQGYVMAVLPSDRRVGIDELNRSLRRHLGLAGERELGRLFRDCEPGAIPALGPAYGIRTVMDKSLIDVDEIWFEAGNHEDLIHTDMDTFLELMAEADYASFSRRTD